LTFKEITRLYIRHKLALVVLPILMYQVVSVILVYNPETLRSVKHAVHWIWCGSALPRLLQRYSRFSAYFESIAVFNPSRIMNPFCFALLCWCAANCYVSLTECEAYIAHRITRSTQVDPNVNVKKLQAVRIGLIILLSSHWVGCTFYLIARLQNFSSVTWISDFEELLPTYRVDESDVGLDYLICVYKGFNTLSNLAYDLGVPANLAEVFCSLAAMLGQVYISALILGTLLNYLVRRDPVEEAHKQLMEQVRNFMDSKSIPSDLYERVVSYYQFQHNKNRQLQAAGQVNLPKSLKIKVANANYRDLIDRCAASGRPFYGCKEQLFNALLVKLSMVLSLSLFPSPLSLALPTPPIPL